MKLEPIQSCTFSGLHSSIFLSLSLLHSISHLSLWQQHRIFLFSPPDHFLSELVLEQALQVVDVDLGGEDAALAPFPPFQQGGGGGGEAEAEGVAQAPEVALDELEWNEKVLKLFHFQERFCNFPVTSKGT